MPDDQQEVEGASSSTIPGPLDIKSQGEMYFKDYESSGDLAKLDEAIKLTTMATLARNPNWDFYTLTFNLAVMLRARHKEANHAGDFEKAFQLCQIGVRGVPSGHPREAMLLSVLGLLFQEKYETSKARADLEEGIRYGQKATTVASEGHPDRIACLLNFASQLKDQFDADSSLTDLSWAIRLIQEATELTPVSDPSKLDRLHYLANVVMVRFSKTGDSRDLDRVVKLNVEVLCSALRDHPRTNTIARRVLGTLTAPGPEPNSYRREDDDYFSRFLQAFATALIREQSVPSQPLFAVLQLLRLRTLATKSMDDLGEIIRVNEWLLGNMSTEHSDRVYIIHMLVSDLEIRFQTIKQQSDIDRLLELERNTLQEMHNAEDVRRWQTSLAVHLFFSFWTSYDLNLLHEAVRLSKTIISTLQPLLHSQRTGGILDIYLYHFEKLTTIHSALLNNNGDILELARGMQTDDIDPFKLLPSFDEREVRNITLISLLTLLKRIYQEYKVLREILDESELKVRDELKERGVSGKVLDRNEGLARLHAFREYGTLRHLDEAIAISRNLIQGNEQDDADKAAGLIMLCVQLRHRFARTNSFEDLNEAIDTVRQAVAIIRQCGLPSLRTIGDLAIVLMQRYEHTGSAPDLDESIQLMDEALYPFDEPDPIYRSTLLHTRALQFEMVFERDHQIHDIDEAIRIGEEALRILPEGDARRTKHLLSVASKYEKRIAHTENPADVAILLSLYDFGLKDEASRPEDRITCGKKSILLTAMGEMWEMSHAAAVTSVDLVPKIVSHSQDTPDKSYLLKSVAELGSLAAGAALGDGKEASHALELLERSRGVMGGMLEETRTDFKHLQTSNPKLFEDVTLLVRMIEQPLIAVTAADPGRESLGVVQVPSPIDAKNVASEKLASLREKILQEEGFEEFAQVPSVEQMQDAAKNGPIAIINVTAFRSDAILIDKNHTRSLALPRLKYREVEDRVRMKAFGSLNTLKWLWEVLAEPVLEALKLTSTLPEGNDNNQRMWWIPIGSLNLFPIHAAGDYLYTPSRIGKSVLDRVQSSYSSSVTAIIRARKRLLNLSMDQALLLAMEHTPGSTTLPSVAQEIEAVRVVYESIGLTSTMLNQPSTESVLRLLPTSNTLHFAGHGFTDLADPLKSFLLLGKDDKRDPLTVAEMLKLNLRSSAPFLAFLSACSTSKTGDSELSDESIHLASAFQLAGFRHVVGTLWEVQDEVCLDMSRIFYQSMAQERAISDLSVCRALHQATVEVRDRWRHSNKLRGEPQTQKAQHSKKVSNIKRGDHASGEDPMSSIVTGIQNMGVGIAVRDITEDDLDDDLIEPPWVPFVHFGV